MSDKIIHLLLTNPAVVGAIICTALTWIHAGLVKLDKSGSLNPYSKQLHIAFLVVSFIASVLDAASKGDLSSLDLNSISSFIQYWVLTLVGGKAMSVSNIGKKEK
jgi:hypothetical protein